MNVLLSYGWWGTRPLEVTLHDLFGDDRALWPGVMVDSGAVQARSIGKDVTPQGYAEWLIEAEGLWDVAVSLDVIFDPVASEANHAILTDEYGLHDLLPVFHGGEPWRYLEQMVERHDYIALGGMVSANAGAGLKPWLGRCFQIAGDTRIHGLGMTQLELMLKAPWASVDSSSWGAGHRFGSVAVWTGRKMLRARRGHPRWPQVVRGVRRAGYDPDRLDGDYQYVAEVNAYAWLQMAAAVNHARPEFTMYLVDGAPFAMKAIARAAARLEQENP